jgi:putative transposase
VNARIRKAVRVRGHFPNEQAALKCVYMALMSLDPNRRRPPAVDHALESTPERLPDRRRRPAHPGQPLTTSTTKISR